jgi:hypothetical protein
MRGDEPDLWYFVADDLIRQEEGKVVARSNPQFTPADASKLAVWEILRSQK